MRRSHTLNAVPPPLMAAGSAFLLQLPLKLAICVATAYRASVPATAGVYRSLSDAAHPERDAGKRRAKAPASAITPLPLSGPRPAPRGRLSALVEETEMSSRMSTRGGSAEGDAK